MYALVAAAAVALLFSGCGTTSYRYVSSTKTRTFFKLPHSWSVFSQDQIIASLEKRNPTVNPPDPFPFFVVFDADRQPSPVLDKIVKARFPIGLAKVRTLSTAERVGYSFDSLRNEVVQVDQINQNDPNAIEDVSKTTLLVRGGLRGMHMELTVHGSKGENFSFDQVGLIDSSTQTVWVLVVGCATDCYRTNASTIHRVVDSWTVKEK